MPVRAIRNKLRLIRYYSATRPYNRWSRALDIALAASLLLALPATWLLDRAYVAHVSPVNVSGKLFENPDGHIWAWLRSPGLPWAFPPPEIRGRSIFAGTFRLSVRTEEHGWPFVTSRRARRTPLDVDLFAAGASPGDDPVDAPLRSRIHAALLEAGHEDAAGLWETSAGATAVSHRPRAWLANGLIWSLLLPACAWATVSILRLGWMLAGSAQRGRRQQRQRELRCITCGYDLRGSAFSERCPECGTLVG